MNRRGFLAALTGVLAPASLAAAAAPGVMTIRTTAKLGMNTATPSTPLDVLPGDQVLGFRTSIERLRLNADGSVIFRDEHGNLLAELPAGSVNLAPPSA